MSSYESLISNLKVTVAPDDIIGAMLCEMNGQEMPTDPNKIHGAIKELKEEFPSLLKDFVFFKGNSYPFSETLERVLFRLEASLLLSTMNPSYESYSIKVGDDVKEMFKSKFSPNKYNEIKKMALRFTSLINSIEQ